VEHGLTVEDQLFILMQAGLYLTVTRGIGAPEARICYEHAESLCHLLNHPRLLCLALIGQFTYILITDKMSAAMRIAEQVYSRAQEQNDPELMLRASSALSCTRYYLSDFACARQYGRHGVQIWRSGDVQTHTEDFEMPVIGCLCYGAMAEWHLGEIAACHANIRDAISIAKELNDMNSLAFALTWAAALAINEGNLDEVDRLASDLIELSTRYNDGYWLAHGTIYRGWVRSASGDSEEGIPWIDQGIRELRASGSVVSLASSLVRKAEALHLADRASEAFETINEAEALAERFEQRVLSARLHWLRGVFLAALGADVTQTQTSFRESIRIAREQKSISLAKRAEATYAQYCRQKASGSGGRGFRLPLW
jgi:tetratricopeptide (TPR) repeat protein